MQTIFPEENIKAVVRGSLIRMITAANRLGLYSAFLACIAIFFKSNLPQSRSTIIGVIRCYSYNACLNPSYLYGLES